MKKIVVDTLGSDNGEEEIVLGAIEASKINEEYAFCLVGNFVRIHAILLSNGVDTSRFEIMNAPMALSNNEDPRSVVGIKSKCSMGVAFDTLKADDEAIGLISAGSTGGIIISAIFNIGLLKGIKYPALASILFKSDGSRVCLVDCGANIDPNKFQLLSFAKMGSALIKSRCSIESPAIGLLNVGKEDHKGTNLLRETHQLLKQSGLNFVGNVEGGDIFLPGVDVVVSDGFTGNIVLKSAETVAHIASRIVRDESKDPEEGERIASKIDEWFSYNELGGAFVLGTKKMVAKAHGAATRKTIVSIVKDIVDMDKGGMTDNLLQSLSEVR